MNREDIEEEWKWLRIINTNSIKRKGDFNSRDFI